MTALGTIRRTMFGIPSEKAVFSRPGFAKEAWERFQPVARSLVAGYHATLEDSRLEVLVPRLDAIEPELHGFAYEGAAMGLAALDIMAPWKNRVNELVAGPGAKHIYPIYVGVGLALARLRRPPEAYLGKLDPVLSWVIVDGYGFHEGFFARRRYIDQHAIPSHLSPYAQRLFDQGLGRAIWFSSGARVDLVTSIVGGFQPQRQVDVWSGIGLACAYGGGLDRAQLEALRAAAGPYRAQLARGAAVAAWGRQQAGNLVPHTDLACQVFGGVSSEEAAHTADIARSNIAITGGEPAHEIWRQRTQARFAGLE
ncbi:DUF1702 family protein [Chloroflexia bacterium SDU3-3]|nr:DUF1702 family protein [Chloroflexia bacterium SDU3-3]